MNSDSLFLFTSFVAIFSCLALSHAQNATFGFACSRADGLCVTGTCDISTQACVCPTDGKTYNYACAEVGSAQGVCEETNVYGPNCNIPRVGVYCVAGKMFLNVLTHGGNTKFSGSMYIKEKQGTTQCEFQSATAQTFSDREDEYELTDAGDMDGYFLELENVDANCGDAVARNVPAVGDEPAHTMYSRQFYIQYNPNYQASLDQFVTAECKEFTGATSTVVYVGIGEVSSADDTSNYDEVNVQSEVGVVNLELLDTSYQPLTDPIALGTEIVLRFNLGSNNQYTAIWLSGCKANNSLDRGDGDFKEIDLIGTDGCPATSAVGVFKSFPSKPAVAANQPQVILMSIGAFRFTGSSDKVTFMCTVNLCKAGDEANCNPPQECAGFQSTALVLTDTSAEPAAALTATITSNELNPVNVNQDVILTCSATGGDGTYTYEIFRGAEVSPVSSTATFTVNVADAKTDTYKCKVTDGSQASADSSEISVTTVSVLTVQVHAVPPGPVVKGTDITLTCKAAGYTQGTPSYSWTRAGTADFSTDAEITDTSADAGTITYTCTVTVDAATETSPAVDVVFTAAAPAAALTATITSNELNPVNVGQDVILTCSATGGDGTYTYEIFRGAEVSPVSSTATFTANVADAKTDTYKCKVTDGSQASAESSEISVTAVSVLTVQVHAVPPGPVVKETDITLTCKAAGYTQGTPSYSWTRAGTADFSTDAEITDTSADAATITYTCTVTVDTVSETSAAVDVVFTEPAAALTATINSNELNPVNVNQDVILTCSATGGDGTYTYEIFRGAEVSPVSSTATFTVNVADAKTDTYKCKVTDGSQASADSSEISVTTVSVLTVQVHAVPPGPVVKGTDITLTCKAAGYTQGTPSYSWTRAGAADFSTVAEITDTSADAATITYTCTVTVDTATATSPAVDVVFTEAARKRRSAPLIRSRRDAEDSEGVTAVVRVYDPNGVTDGYVQPVKEKECVNKSDVTVVVIILSVFLFLLLVIATILGAMVLRSRQKVAGLGFKGREFEPPMHTMSMPRLEINSSGYGSSVGSHGV
ncbi:hypothetical protein RRG08_013907 [Elysia crispata]|uniref:Uncharacterized protein n=1 Tax=Elysia crispata TaxID=231223 RepID=A0AAE1DBM9_9GAST|nr:hypothetical protein RRG08_013907 [Elysia crispata]